MDEKSLRVLLNFGSAILIAALAADFAWVIRTALGTPGAH